MGDSNRVSRSQKGLQVGSLSRLTKSKGPPSKDCKGSFVEGTPARTKAIRSALYIYPKTQTHVRVKGLEFIGSLGFIGFMEFRGYSRQIP